MKLILTIILIFFIIHSCITVDPKPLAQKYTQSWTAYDNDDTLCSGKIFYDSTTLSQRINVIDSGPNCCGALDQTIKSCQFMQINQTVYGILPDQKFCCYMQDIGVDIIPRDMFNYLNYTGEQLIDGAKYYVWQFNTGEDIGGIFKFYTDQSQKRIWKRIQFTDTSFDQEYLNIDFWPGSYTQKFSDKTAFEIPKYCSDECDGLMRKMINKSFIRDKLLRRLRRQLLRSQ